MPIPSYLRSNADVEPPIFEIPNNDAHERVSALFLGPKAENASLLQELLNNIVGSQVTGRQSYFPGDPVRFVLRFVRRTIGDISCSGFHIYKCSSVFRVQRKNRTDPRCTGSSSRRLEQTLYPLLLSSLQCAHVRRPEYACNPGVSLNNVLQSEQRGIRGESLHDGVGIKSWQANVSNDGLQHP